MSNMFKYWEFHTKDVVSNTEVGLYISLGIFEHGQERPENLAGS